MPCHAMPCHAQQLFQWTKRSRTCARTSQLFLWFADIDTGTCSLYYMSSYCRSRPVSSANCFGDNWSRRPVVGWVSVPRSITTTLPQSRQGKTRQGKILAGLGILVVGENLRLDTPSHSLALPNTYTLFLARSLFLLPNPSKVAQNVVAPAH